MLSTAMAIALKEAGLLWKPSVNDFFVIPDSGLEDKVFVLSDVSAYVNHLRGHPAVTFHGSVEWAMDYIWVADVAWIPTEDQLREAIEHRLVRDPHANFSLHNTRDGYICELRFSDETLTFDAFRGTEAYAKALLYLLGRGSGTVG